MTAAVATDTVSQGTVTFTVLNGATPVGVATASAKVTGGAASPLNQRAIETLKFWAQAFPSRQSAHFVFPSEQYGLYGTEGTFGGTIQVYDYAPDKPVGTIQKAWQSAKKRTQRHCPNCGDGTLIDREKPATGYECEGCHFETPTLPAALARFRSHDLRHSSVSRMIAARIPIRIIAKVVGWSRAQWRRWPRDMVTLESKSSAASWNPSVPPQFMKIRQGTRKIHRSQPWIVKKISTKLLILLVGGQGLEPRTSCL